jgi:tRNA G46 methylase TrmB
MKHEHAGHSSKEHVDIPKVISMLVDRKAVFLDIGCGPGDYLKEASKLTENSIGIDVHASSIEAVRSMGDQGHRCGRRRRDSIGRRLGRFHTHGECPARLHS